MSIHYTLEPSQPDAHLLSIALVLDKPDPMGQHFSLPNWIPGSYMVRDFSRNIVEITAESNGAFVPLEKLDKSSWAAPEGLTQLSLHYIVYAWELSVRAAHFDRNHAFFNGSSVFLCVDGQSDESVSVDLKCPKHDKGKHWQVATALPARAIDKNGFGLYQARNYDELIDHPVEMSNFERVEFSACGIPHELVLTGACHFDRERLAADLTRICEHHIRFFGKPAPVDRYVFLVMVVGSGYGGLEHRASTALLISRDNLPVSGEQAIDDKYLDFLGLCSHEYFHTWNVKRIKPARFVPYELNAESYTRLLWFFEGITSYYDDLALVRSGLIDTDCYLGLLAKTLTRVQRGAGRRLQSVTDSSYDAWHKFYKQDENAPNAIVSYYAKGALIAMCLDVEIRRATGGMKTLDTLMRQLWQHWLDSEEGLAEDEPELLASKIAGVELKDFFSRALYSTEELPLEEALAYLGVELNWRQRKSSNDSGTAIPKKAEPVQESTTGQAKNNDSEQDQSDIKVDEMEGVPWLGAILKEQNGCVKVVQVMSGSPAQDAGLAGGDTLVALECQSVSVEGVERLLRRYADEGTITVHYFRLGELLETSLPIRSPALDTATLTRTDEKSIESWLVGNASEMP
ncbi:MAG: PDZ domain-containing protein [Granulosicoccus sp.]